MTAEAAWYRDELLRLVLGRLEGVTDTSTAAVDVLIAGLCHRQIPDGEVSATFHALAGLFPTHFTADNLDHLPLLVDMYASFGGVLPAVQKMLLCRPLNSAVLRHILAENWLNRMCCLQQPPNALEAITRMITRNSSQPVPQTSLLTILKICQGATEDHSSLRVYILEILQRDGCSCAAFLLALRSTLRQLDIVIVKKDLRWRAANLALCGGAHVADGTQAEFLANLRLPTGSSAWSLASCWLARYVPDVGMWNIWFQQQFSGLQPVAPGALYALAKFAEKCSPSAAYSILTQYLSSCASPFNTLASLFAMVRAAYAVRAVNPEWTRYMVQRLGAESRGMAYFRKAVINHNRLQKRFRRAFLKDLSRMARLWQSCAAPRPECKMTEIVWRCYKANREYWAACEHLCDVRDVAAWTRWVRGALIKGHSHFLEEQAPILVRMLEECARAPPDSAGVAVFLHTIVSDMPALSALKPRLLAIVLSMPTASVAIRRKAVTMALRHLISLGQLQMELPPCLLEVLSKKYFPLDLSQEFAASLLERVVATIYTAQASEDNSVNLILAGCALDATMTLSGMGKWQPTPQRDAYFTKLALQALHERNFVGVELLLQSPMDMAMLAASVGEDTGFWHRADAILEDAFPVIDIYYQHGLALRALLSTAVPLTALAASTALEFMASFFLYDAADMRAVLRVVIGRWPELQAQAIRLSRLAAGSPPANLCVCRSNGMCYHAVFGLAADETTAAVPYDCSICYESVSLRAGVTLACKHVFHRDCIQTWFQRTAPIEHSCPLCREKPSRVLCFTPSKPGYLRCATCPFPADLPSAILELL
jgi:hypothetical protein